MADDYTRFVPSANRKDKFLAVIEALTGSLGQLVDTTTALTDDFSLAHAEGAQLDVVGQWVGIDRAVRTPVANQFFSWDTSGKGWDEGYWKGAFVPTEGIAFLDDTSFRAALRFKVMQNSWPGPMSAFYLRWVLLEGSTPNLMVATDNMDMSMAVRFYGPPISIFLRLFIEQQGLVPKPLGVRIASYTYTTVPVFGLDEATLSINGPDFGHLI